MNQREGIRAKRLERRARRLVYSRLVPEGGSLDVELGNGIGRVFGPTSPSPRVEIERDDGRLLILDVPRRGVSVRTDRRIVLRLASGDDTVPLSGSLRKSLDALRDTVDRDETSARFDEVVALGLDPDVDTTAWPLLELAAWQREHKKVSPAFPLGVTVRSRRTAKRFGASGAVPGLPDGATVIAYADAGGAVLAALATAPRFEDRGIALIGSEGGVVPVARDATEFARLLTLNALPGVRNVDGVPVPAFSHGGGCPAPVRKAFRGFARDRFGLRPLKGDEGTAKAERIIEKATRELRGQRPSSTSSSDS